MTTLYRVWWASAGDEEKDGRDISAYDFDEAAELYAEQRIYRDGDGDLMDRLDRCSCFCVRLAGTDDVRSVEIHVDWEPSFHANEVGS